MTAAPFFGREPFLSWQKKNFVRILVFSGEKRDPRMPDVPTLYEIFDKEKVPEASRRVAEIILAADSFGRPIFATPGMPADRLKVLRHGFKQALKDPELLVEAEKSKMDIDPDSGETLEKLSHHVLSQPPEVVGRVKKLLCNSVKGS
jgi:tripartite-type tricarboxylate transporter receptor subunit TctC